MQDVAKSFESVINEIRSEIKQLEKIPRKFEHLRDTPFEFFEKIDFSRVYLLDNGIYTIKNPDNNLNPDFIVNPMDVYNSLADEDEKSDFIFEDGNWPTFNTNYVKEVIYDGYIMILYETLHSLELKKIEFCTKAEYYQPEDFRTYIIDHLDTHNTKLLNYDGQLYSQGKSPFEPFLIFDSKLDLISHRAMTLTTEIIDGGNIDLKDKDLRNKVYLEYGYPGLYIDWKQWYDFESSIRMIEILKTVISIPHQTRTSEKKILHLKSKEKIILMMKLGFLEHLENSHLISSNVKQAKIISALCTVGVDNARKFLGELNSNPEKLGPIFSEYEDKIDKFLKEL